MTEQPNIRNGRPHVYSSPVTAGHMTHLHLCEDGRVVDLTDVSAARHYYDYPQDYRTTEEQDEDEVASTEQLAAWLNENVR